MTASESMDRGQPLADLGAQVISCRKCPRLVAWRELIASSPRAAFAEQTYWGRAIPGFGDSDAHLLIVGLAPAAHGGNRTGRMFTGDRSGDFLYGALHRAGYANQPDSSWANDGLRLSDAYITAAVRCAPPDNRPTPKERDTCGPYLGRELTALRMVTVILVLGAFAFDAVLRQLSDQTERAITPRPKFRHGLEIDLGSHFPQHAGKTLLCSYHPSQRNVFTGLLTAAAFDEVLARANALTA